MVVAMKKGRQALSFVLLQSLRLNDLIRRPYEKDTSLLDEYPAHFRIKYCCPQCSESAYIEELRVDAQDPTKRNKTGLKPVFLFSFSWISTYKQVVKML